MPHCARTTRADDPVIEWPDEGWICAPHWRLVPAKMKAVKRRARRALSEWSDAAAVSRFVRISKRCTRAAIELAAGI